MSACHMPDMNTLFPGVLSPLHCGKTFRSISEACSEALGVSGATLAGAGKILPLQRKRGGCSQRYSATTEESFCGVSLTFVDFSSPAENRLVEQKNLTPAIIAPSLLEMSTRAGGQNPTGARPRYRGLQTSRALLGLCCSRSEHTLQADLMVHNDLVFLAGAPYAAAGRRGRLMGQKCGSQPAGT